MEQNLAVALMFVTIVVAFTILIIALMNYRIKNRLIRSGLADENAIKSLNKLQFDINIDALKWGLILLFAGIGLVLLHYIPYQPESTLPYGIEIICIAAGLLTYMFVSRKLNRTS
ncbi:hypothetical protein CKK33_14780 [Mucilaginibacter sp. MD40]|uniref:DUF6249 domain-containing protein n=1 Tax=Mucilaginibacter sp. MD40 TaxID=2029590 RepID=UPI000BAC82FE|nr:DUF6249 domain-containing protein [Mucilaginibacter sp. MD40]PAW94690.1 hypothetical protein CKK33_14780 [Mucilaginibacter sp. MD40]